MKSKLIRRSWLFREWQVSLPAGHFIVSYSGHGIGFESVSVDGVVVVKTTSRFWYVPLFEFTLGDLPGIVDVRVWPWLSLRAIRLRIGSEIYYTEGHH